MTGCKWRHAPEAQRFLGISKEVSRIETRRWTRRFDFWGSLRWDEFARHGCHTREGPDEEASITRLCFSPYVETFNSKVIKRFRTWTKKSLRVFEFRDSCVLRYVYMLLTFDVRFAHGRIWLCNITRYVTSNSAKHQLFVYTQLQDQTVLFLI